MQIVKEIWEKCKSKEFLLSFTIVLFGILSFGLGRLSKTYNYGLNSALLAPKGMLEEITVNQVSFDGEKLSASTAKSIDQKSYEEKGIVVASKTGKKYHLPWCTGAKNIPENNKIWFNSIDEAKKAGYTPALNCKGLK